MTKEQYEKATELNTKIEKYNNIIESIKHGLRMKTGADRKAKETIAKQSKINLYYEEWTLKNFFSLIFEKQKVKVIPHYEFARVIELDADAELIDLILDYLQKKKSDFEKEFEQLGGGIE